MTINGLTLMHQIKRVVDQLSSVFSSHGALQNSSHLVDRAPGSRRSPEHGFALPSAPANIAENLQHHCVVHLAHSVHGGELPNELTKSQRQNRRALCRSCITTENR
jgi:hypothetical protein